MVENAGPAAHDNGAPGGAVPLKQGAFLPVNGVDQWVTFRGASPRNPALLVLGGPGAAFSEWAPLFAPWEEHFTVVQWDQPGGGRTLARHGQGAGPLTLERLARDAIAVAEHACRWLGKRKLGVLGFSGGTIVGLMLAKRRPDLVSAYAGNGQFVDWARQDAASYALLLAQARRSGDAAATAELTAIGPPPYPDTATDAVKSKYAGALTAAERTALAVLDPATLALFDPSHSAEVSAASMRAYDELRDDLVGFDARRLGLTFEVPMFFLQGELDAFAVTAEVEAYAESIVAPEKRFVPIEGSGHFSLVMRDELLRLLDRHVRPAMTAAET
jgi:pimeloyl-ACP methyl ester carboxylesterase